MVVNLKRIMGAFGGFSSAANHGNSGGFAKKRFALFACSIILVASVAASYFGYIVTTDTKSAFNSLNSSYQNLTQQYSALQTDYSSLQQNLSQLRNDFASSQANFSALQNQLAALKSQLNISEARQSAFQSNLSSFQANLAALSQWQAAAGNASAFSYLVYADASGTYWAENGTTRALDFSGTSGGEVGQRCIDALAETGGKIVFAGRVNLTSPLTIQDGRTAGLLVISGLGASTQLVSSPGGDCIDILGGQPYGYGGPYHIVISDLVLTSETSPQGNSMNVGISIKNWFGADIQNVMVFYAAKAGIYLEDAANVHLNNVYVEGCCSTEYGGATALEGNGFWLRGSKDCYFTQCFSDTNQIGFLFDSNPKTNSLPQSLFLTQCEATLNQQQGVCIADARGVVFSDSLVEGSNSDGIMIVDSQSVNVVDSMVNGNAGNGIVVTTQNASMLQSQIAIRNCMIDSNSRNGVGLWAKNGFQISQVAVEGCSVTNSGAAARQAPSQVDVWDGMNVSNDAVPSSRCSYVTVSNCFLGNVAGTYATQKFGVRSLQASDYIQVVGNSFFGNISGNCTLAGSHNTVSGNRDQ